MTFGRLRRWIWATLAAGALMIVPLLLSADQVGEFRCIDADGHASHELEQLLLILQEEDSVPVEANGR